MIHRTRNDELGFSVIDTAIVVLLIGLLIAFAVPSITNGMREYRLNIAARQMADLINRAKTQAVSENRRASLRVDTSNNRVGIVVFDNNNNEVRTDYISLPPGVTFSMPENVNAPMPGAPTTGSVSFPAYGGSQYVFQQNFTARGFPDVAAAGTVNAVYLSNGRSFRAITLNSVGGVRTWNWEDSKWVSTRTGQSYGSGK